MLDKRKYLLWYFCLVFCLLFLFYTYNLYDRELINYSFVCASTAVASFLLMLLQKKFFYFSKFAFILLCIFTIFLFDDGVYGKGATYLYYSPLVITIMLIYSKKERFTQVLFFTLIFFTILCVHFLDIGPSFNKYIEYTNHIDILISSILTVFLLTFTFRSSNIFEEQLIESYSKLESLINSTDDVIWSVNKNYFIINKNKVFDTLHLNLGVATINENESAFKNLVNEKSVIIWRNLYHTALQGEAIKKIITHKVNDQFQYIEYSFYPIKVKDDIVGCTVVGRDISLIKRKEDEINKIKSFYEMIFEKMHISVSVYDKNLKYVYTNPASIKDNTMRQLAIGLNDIEFANLTNVRQDNAKVRFDIMIEQKKSKDYFEYIEQIGTLTGGEMQILRQFLPIIKDGKLEYIITFGTDISKLKMMEYEISLANEAKEKALKIKQQFLSIMSHEIRTPLNAVISLSEFIVQDNNSPDVNDKIGMLKLATDQIQKLVTDVLDYSKIEAGKIDLENERFDLHLLLKLEYEAFKDTVKEKSIDLIIDVEEAIPQFLLGDQYRLQQILNNLISNAIKFTSEGEVTLQLKCESKDEDFCSISFAITDTGIGIASSKIKSIFEVFTQAESSTTRKYGGSGLGLSIVKKLLELLGSEIVVESKEGRGTRFAFTILYRLSDEIEQAKDTTEIIHNLKGKKALVADDNPINLFIVKKQLSDVGIEVDFAENGQVAVDKVILNNYDFILMDISMPVLDGYDATRKIKNLPNSKKSTIPIIGFTADVLPENQIKMFEAGINDFILKPIKQDKLLAIICRLVK